jgi:hypothetical protein
MAVFYMTLDIGITNAYLLYKMACKDANEKPLMKHSEFREALAVILASGVVNLDSPVIRKTQAANAARAAAADEQRNDESTPLRNKRSQPADNAGDNERLARAARKQVKRPKLVHGIERVSDNDHGEPKARSCAYNACFRGERSHKTGPWGSRGPRPRHAACLCALLDLAFNCAHRESAAAHSKYHVTNGTSTRISDVSPEASYRPHQHAHIRHGNSINFLVLVKILKQEGVGECVAHTAVL